jgi:hypothetical protein
MRLIGLITVAVLTASASFADAQTRTPWGDPDFQGVWTNQTPVPLERPAPLAGKPFFTPEEAAEFEKTALDRLLTQVSGAVPTSGELNAIWLETQHGRVSPSRRTSMIIDPANGLIPYSAEGRKRWEDTPSNERELQGRPNGTDRPEDRSQPERCITTGGLFTPNPFYNNYHQIFQAPGYVVILTEMFNEARIIPVDRRPPLGVGIRQWIGDSRGWWDGATLVVETRNFNDQRRFRGATRDLQLVERFTRLNADTITYQLTVTDPKTFTRPWTLENSFWRTNNKLYEVACHEGNYGMTNILAGARAAEKR